MTSVPDGRAYGGPLGLSPTRPDLLAMLDAYGRLIGWGTAGPTAVRLVQAVDHRGVAIDAGQYSVCPICQALIRDPDLMELPGAVLLVIKEGTPRLVFTELWHAAMREHEQILKEHVLGHSATEVAAALDRLHQERERLKTLLNAVGHPITQ